MRQWIVMLFAVMVGLAVAPASQAGSLMPAGALATAAANSGDTVLVHHRRGHVIKVKRHRHHGWVRGKHKGWSHSRHRQH
jgi:hypothetical protein